MVFFNKFLVAAKKNLLHKMQQSCHEGFEG